jgi:hypothetical protein
VDCGHEQTCFRSGDGVGYCQVRQMPLEVQQCGRGYIPVVAVSRGYHCYGIHPERTRVKLRGQSSLSGKLSGVVVECFPDHASKHRRALSAPG